MENKLSIFELPAYIISFSFENTVQVRNKLNIYHYKSRESRIEAEKTLTMIVSHSFTASGNESPRTKLSFLFISQFIKPFYTIPTHMMSIWIRDTLSKTEPKIIHIALIDTHGYL